MQTRRTTLSPEREITVGARYSSKQRGSTLVQVFVILVATAVGLLGLARLQYRAQVSDLERFQHKLANVLVQDMASRIATNAHEAPQYITASAVGYGTACPELGATRSEQDRFEWCNALQGAGDDSPELRTRAIVGARGCVKRLANDQYMITVAWHGLSRSNSATAGVECGEDLFVDEDSDCANDRCRRAVTTIVSIEPLIQRALAHNTHVESEFIPDSAIAL